MRHTPIIRALCRYQCLKGVGFRLTFCKRSTQGLVVVSSTVWKRISDATLLGSLDCEKLVRQGMSSLGTHDVGGPSEGSPVLPGPPGGIGLVGLTTTTPLVPGTALNRSPPTKISSVESRTPYSRISRKGAHTKVTLHSELFRLVFSCESRDQSH